MSALMLAALLLSQWAQVVPEFGFTFPDAAAARRAWKATEATPPVDVANVDGRHVLRLDVPFGQKPDLVRAAVDRAARLDLNNVDAFRLDVSVNHAEACPRWTLYFHSGDGWYACWARLSPEPGTGPAGSNFTLRFDRSQFTKEGSPDGWDTIDRMRIAVWKGKAVDAEILLRTLAVEQNEYATIASDEPDRQGEAAVAMLENLGLRCAVVKESELATRLANRKVVVLSNVELSRAAETALVDYVERGGKVLAFYALPDRLAHALGFGRGKYHKAQRPGQFAEMRFDLGDKSSNPAALEPLRSRLPPSVKQASWNIIEAHPISADARVIARWYSDDRAPTRRAAVLVSPRGVFVSHVLLDDDWSGKRQMLAALLGHFHEEAWADFVHAEIDAIGQVGHCHNRQQLAEFLADPAVAQPPADSRSSPPTPETLERAKAAQARFVERYYEKVASRTPEARAVWNHSGTGAFPGDWQRSAKLLEDNGLNMVLPNMLWGGLAHYPSKLLPHSQVYRQYGDQVEQCCAAAHTHGLEVHVWKVNFNLSNAPESFVGEMRAADRTQVSVDGKPRAWLCPSHPENQKLERESMLEVARMYPVDGLHFDYIRYPGRESCYCDDCRARFEAASGMKVAHWPKDCYDGPRAEAYSDWRCKQISALVESVAREGRTLRPGLKISAAVFAEYPGCRKGVGQDWVAWARAGWVDFLCPMDYTDQDEEFQRIVKEQVRLVAGRVPIYPGIGATAGLVPLRPDRVVGQVYEARQAGAAGFTIFDFGPQTAADLVPALGRSVGRQRAIVPGVSP